jgi:pyridoxal 5'-phosphate synthase pdxS subunit
MMQLGAQTVFVGSGIFMKEGNIRLEVSRWAEGDTLRKGDLLADHPVDPADFGKPVPAEFVGAFRNPAERAEAESRAKAIVRAATHFNDPAILAECSEECMGAMKGLAVGMIAEADMMQTRGW